MTKEREDDKAWRPAPVTLSTTCDVIITDKIVILVDTPKTLYDILNVKESEATVKFREDKR